MNSSASKALVAERTKQIVDLHLGIEASLRRSVQDAIRLGELLTEQKAALPHGDFLPWLDRELPFSERTARNYMKLFEYRTKTATVADLRTAYEVAQIEDQRQHPKARPEVAPEEALAQKQRHDDFVKRIHEEPAPEPEEPRIDVDELLREAHETVGRSKSALARDQAGDTDPVEIIAETVAYCEHQLSRTKASGVHMVVNEMVKFWREKSIEMNRKAGR